MTTSLPLDHSGLGVLPRAECLRRLAAARVGRVAFVNHDGLQLIPLLGGMLLLFRELKDAPA